MKLLTHYLCAATTLSAILLALVFSPSVFAAQDSETLKNSAEALFAVARQTNSTLVKTFEHLESEGLTVPQASRTEYEQALLYMSEAEEVFSAGNYQQSNAKILQTLQKFKEALRIISETVQEPATQEEMMREQKTYLRDALSRAYSWLTRLENTTRSAKEQGYSTTLAETELETIKSMLDQATSKLAKNDLANASSIIAQAKLRIDKLMAYYNNLANSLKIQRLEAYMVQAEARFRQLKQQVNALSASGNTSANIKNATVAALNQTQNSLNNAKEYLNKNMIDETINELVSAKQSEQEVVRILASTQSTASTATDEASSTSVPNTPNTASNTSVRSTNNAVLP